MFAILYIFFSNLSRGDGGVLIIFVENPEGMGGGGGRFTVFWKKWKIRGGVGVLSELPSVVGVWIFLEPHIVNCKQAMFVPKKESNESSTRHFIVSSVFNANCVVFFFNKVFLEKRKQQILLRQLTIDV